MAKENKPKTTTEEQKKPETNTELLCPKAETNTELLCPKAGTATSSPILTATSQSFNVANVMLWMQRKYALARGERL